MVVMTGLGGIGVHGSRNSPRESAPRDDRFFRKKRTPLLAMQAVIWLSWGASGLGCCVIGDFWSESSYYEFLEEVSDGAAEGSEACVFKGEAEAVAIAGRVVEVGDSAGCEAADDSGVIELPVSVVAFAEDGVGNRIEDAGTLCAGAFVEVTGVLLPPGGEDGSADHGGDESVGVAGPKALGVTLRALAVSAEAVGGLFDSGDDPGGGEGDGIDVGLPGEREFLASGEWGGVGVVGYVEVGEDAEDALGFFQLQLLFGNLLAGGCDLDIGGCAFDCEHNRIYFKALAGGDGSGDGLGNESGGGDGEFEGAGSGGGKVEAAVAVGCGGDGRSEAGLGEFDMGAFVDGTGVVYDYAVDAGGGLGDWLGELLGWYGLLRIGRLGQVVLLCPGGGGTREEGEQR